MKLYSSWHNRTQTKRHLWFSKEFFFYDLKKMPYFANKLQNIVLVFGTGQKPKISHIFGRKKCNLCFEFLASFYGIWRRHNKSRVQPLFIESALYCAPIVEDKLKNLFKRLKMHSWELKAHCEFYQQSYQHFCCVALAIDLSTEQNEILTMFVGQLLEKQESKFHTFPFQLHFS